MATETLLPSAASSPDGWTLGAGASKQAAVAADDGDTSYINSGATINTGEQFALGDTSALQSGDTIDGVAVQATCKRGGASTAQYVVEMVLSGSTSTGATQTSGATYVQTTDNFASKPGGGAWTKADLDAVELKIRNTQARDVRCTQLAVVVTYTPAAASGRLSRPPRLDGLGGCGQTEFNPALGGT